MSFLNISFVLNIYVFYGMEKQQAKSWRTCSYLSVRAPSIGIASGILENPDLKSDLLLQEKYFFFFYLA